MQDERIALIGGASLVGQVLAKSLREMGMQITAFSRRKKEDAFPGDDWRRLTQFSQNNESIATWIYLAPIWTLQEHVELMTSYSVRRLIVLSSTSRFTKIDASNQKDKMIAEQLLDGELELQKWAALKGIDWVILRPTLIYGCGLDKNVSQILDTAYRFRCFPLLGEARGLRQPIHVRDVAAACVAAALNTSVRNISYNISGAEVLSYREMVMRILRFAHSERSQKVPVRVIVFPLWFMKMAILLLRCLPRFRYISVGMVLRMNQDLLFSHEEAARDFGFSPGGFNLQKEDLPSWLLCQEGRDE